MLDATSTLWRCHMPVVQPRSCMRRLTPKLPMLHRSLHTATLTKAMQRPGSSSQGKHICLVLQS